MSSGVNASFICKQHNEQVGVPENGDLQPTDLCLTDKLHRDVILITSDKNIVIQFNVQAIIHRKCDILTSFICLLITELYCNESLKLENRQVGLLIRIVDKTVTEFFLIVRLIVHLMTVGGCLIFQSKWSVS